MMGEARVPCACEADVYGALTTLLLQNVAGAPAFLTDLVDLDADDDTGVVWHCGQAPISMADPDAVARATIHTNRKMPLLFEFPLKPGRVTVFRISQARGRPTAVIGGGEVLKRPMAFTGTSGVVRFDTPAKDLLDRIMGAALEHHMALAYGDHRNALDAAARSLGLPVLDL
jgi:L-fucose isomerase-like protein